MKSVMTYTSLLACLVVASCVTVNVNFPEGAVQRAADDYVSELYKAKEQSQKDEKPVAPAAKDKSSFWEVIEFLPEAHAQAPSFTTDTPRAKEIQSKQKGRLGLIDEYKTKGVIGEVQAGLIGIKDGGALKPIEKKRVEGLVADENKDRADLYAEIASANKITGAGIDSVKKSFAEAFLKASPAGTFYLEGGAWKKK